MKRKRSKKKFSGAQVRDDDAVIELPHLLDSSPGADAGSSNSGIGDENDGGPEEGGEEKQEQVTQTRKKAPPPEGVIDQGLEETGIGGGDDAKASESPQVVMVRLRKRFSVFFIFGAIVILGPLPPFYGAPAIAVMFAYIFSSKSIAHRPTEREVFADSIYYMGFLFTFIALFKTIGPLAVEQDFADTNKVIGNLGIALSTTVLGMAARVMMTHFDQILSAPEEDLRDNVATMGAQLHDELQKSIIAFSDFRREAINEMSGLEVKISEDVVGQIRRVFDELIGQMALSIERMEDSSIKFQEKVDAIDLSPGLLRDRVGEAFSEVDKEAPKFAEVIARTTEDADKLRKEVGKVGENMQSAADALSQLTNETESLSGLATAAVDGQQALEKLNSTIDDFKRAIAGIEARSQQSYDDQFQKISNMSRSIESTQRTFEKTTQEAEGMRASFEKVIDDVLSFLKKELRR